MNDIGIIWSNSGDFFIVDAEDIPILSGKTWRKDEDGYARRTKIYFKDGKRKYTTELMHRLINGTPERMTTDHINGFKTDNRKRNLRDATQADNVKNAGAKIKKSKNASRYKSVIWVPHCKKWQAKICINYKQIYLGLFIDEHDAARAYNKAAIRYHGEFAKLNEIKED